MRAFVRARGGTRNRVVIYNRITRYFAKRHKADCGRISIFAQKNEIGFPSLENTFWSLRDIYIFSARVFVQSSSLNCPGCVTIFRELFPLSPSFAERFAQILTLHTPSTTFHLSPCSFLLPRRFSLQPLIRFKELEAFIECHVHGT